MIPTEVGSAAVTVTIYIWIYMYMYVMCDGAASASKMLLELYWGLRY